MKQVVAPHNNQQLKMRIKRRIKIDKQKLNNKITARKLMFDNKIFKKRAINIF